MSTYMPCILELSARMYQSPVREKENVHVVIAAAASDDDDDNDKKKKTRHQSTHFHF